MWCLVAIVGLMWRSDGTGKGHEDQTSQRGQAARPGWRPHAKLLMRMRASAILFLAGTELSTKWRTRSKRELSVHASSARFRSRISS